jgi:hypothetical protein
MLKADVLVLLVVPVLISRLVGFNEQEICTDAELGKQVRFTVPVNPFSAVTVMVELPDPPCTAVVVRPPRSKSAVGVVASHAVIKFATLRDPRPVV